MDKNAFNAWVEERGVEVVADQLRVGRTAVINWLYGRAHPRVIQMRNIKRITKGVIGYDEIIDRKPLPIPKRRTTKE